MNKILIFILTIIILFFILKNKIKNRKEQFTNNINNENENLATNWDNQQCMNNYCEYDTELIYCLSEIEKIEKEWLENYNISFQNIPSDVFENLTGTNTGEWKYTLKFGNYKCPTTYTETKNYC